MFIPSQRLSSSIPYTKTRHALTRSFPNSGIRCPCRKGKLRLRRLLMQPISFAPSRAGLKLTRQILFMTVALRPTPLSRRHERRVRTVRHLSREPIPAGARLGVAGRPGADSQADGLSGLEQASSYLSYGIRLRLAGRVASRIGRLIA